jgi:thioredoxin-like negative regulator of GroEL
LVFIHADSGALTEKYPNLIIAPLKALISDPLPQKLGISTIPMNVIFYKGYYGVMLSGEKNIDSISQFVDNFIVKCDSEENNGTEHGEGPLLVEEDPIIHLDAKDFDSFIAENELVLLDCWAPWCGPCRSQGSILIGGAEKLKEAFPNLIIAKMNTDEDNGLSSQRYDINAIPQLIVFYKGAVGLMRTGTTPIELIQNFIQHFLEVYDQNEEKTGIILDERKDEHDDNSDVCDDDEDETDESNEA